MKIIGALCQAIFRRIVTIGNEYTHTHTKENQTPDQPITIFDTVAIITFPQKCNNGNNSNNREKKTIVYNSVKTENEWKNMTFESITERSIFIHYRYCIDCENRLSITNMIMLKSYCQWIWRRDNRNETGKKAHTHTHNEKECVMVGGRERERQKKTEIKSVHRIVPVSYVCRGKHCKRVTEYTHTHTDTPKQQIYTVTLSHCSVNRSTSLFCTSECRSMDRFRCFEQKPINRPIWGKNTTERRTQQRNRGKMSVLGHTRKQKEEERLTMVRCEKATEQTKKCARTHTHTLSHIGLGYTIPLYVYIDINFYFLCQSIR